MTIRILIIAFLFFLFAGSASCQCFETYRPWTWSESKTQADEDEKRLQFYNSFLGCSMPNFATVSTQNVLISKASLNGKVAVFYFWSLHDGFGVGEAPYLNKLLDTFHRDSVRFIAICTDDSAKWDIRSEKFFRFQHIARSKDLLSKFKTRPVIAIFDKNGKTVFVNFGWEAPDATHVKNRNPELIAAIRKALKE